MSLPRASSSGSGLPPTAPAPSGANIWDTNLQPHIIATVTKCHHQRRLAACRAHLRHQQRQRRPLYQRPARRRGAIPGQLRAAHLGRLSISVTTRPLSRRPSTTPTSARPPGLTWWASPLRTAPFCGSRRQPIRSMGQHGRRPNNPAPPALTRASSSRSAIRVKARDAAWSRWNHIHGAEHRTDWADLDNPPTGSRPAMSAFTSTPSLTGRVAPTTHCVMSATTPSALSPTGSMWRKRT